MRKVLKFIRNYSWSMYLGGSLAALDAGLLTWQFWAIFPVVVVLVLIRENP